MSENEIAGFQYAEGSPACTYKRTIIHKYDEIQHHYHNGIGDYVRLRSCITEKKGCESHRIMNSATNGLTMNL